MQVGWQGIARTIAVTAAVTSAFWVVLGSWLFNRHLEVRSGDDTHPKASQAAQVDHREPPMLVAARAADGAVPIKAIPVVGISPAQLVDTFGQARADGARRHDAIDIQAPLGTLVVAAMPGTVEKLWLSRDGGNTVYVRSPDRRVITYYAHLDGYAPGLAEGQVLQTGAPIGTVGATGNASTDAPHLHFAVWQTEPDRRWSDPAAAINPYPLLTALRPARQAEPRPVGAQQSVVAR